MNTIFSMVGIKIFRCFFKLPPETNPPLRLSSSESELSWIWRERASNEKTGPLWQFRMALKMILDPVVNKHYDLGLSTLFISRSCRKIVCIYYLETKWKCFHLNHQLVNPLVSLKVICLGKRELLLLRIFFKYRYQQRQGKSHTSIGQLFKSKTLVKTIHV